MDRAELSIDSARYLYHPFLPASSRELVFLPSASVTPLDRLPSPDEAGFTFTNARDAYFRRRHCHERMKRSARMTRRR